MQQNPIATDKLFKFDPRGQHRELVDPCRVVDLISLVVELLCMNL